MRSIVVEPSHGCGGHRAHAARAVSPHACFSSSPVVRFVVALATFALVGACASPALDEGRRAQIDVMVRSIQAHAYPELSGVEIQIDSFGSEDVFFESNFDVLAALWGERRYTIYVNPLLFERGVPGDALEGVVAHELAHTHDYQRRDRAGLLALSSVLLFDEDNARFERWTDLQAIARGYGPSLLRYREWQKEILTEEQWRRKLFFYYGPRELALLIDVRGRCPHTFYAMLSTPPLTARDIVTHCP